MAQTLCRRVSALARIACLVLAAAPGAALAADHRHHHGHVGPRNHPRGDIGDAEVERLNEGQLDRNYRGPYTYLPPRAGYAAPSAALAPGAAPGLPAVRTMPGYAPLPPGYPPPPTGLPSRGF